MTGRQEGWQQRQASAAEVMKQQSLRIALAQLDLLVGDVHGNATRIIDTARRARADLKADLVLFPELSLSGYPPEDLLFHRGFRRQIEAGLAKVREEVQDIAVMVGFPEYAGAVIYNSAALITGGSSPPSIARPSCPTTRSSTRSGTSSPARSLPSSTCRGSGAACSSARTSGSPSRRNSRAPHGAELLIVINASPYELHKQRERETVARARVLDVGLPMAYVNMIGGQDELIFDGNSFVMNAEGAVVMRAPAFVEGTYAVDFVRDAKGTRRSAAGADRAGAE